MSAENYANNASTTINDAGGISAGDLSVTVTSAAGFPTAAPYRIIIDSEIIIVTAGAGTTTWTITRGAEGTTAASHADGATVRHVLTRDGLKSIGSVIHVVDTFGNRPSPGVNGRAFYPSDGVMMNLEDGVAWANSFGPLYPFTPPVDGDFAWINQGGASVVTTQGGILLYAPGVAGTNVRVRKKARPSLPYTITAHITPLVFQKRFLSCGLCFRQSSDGKLHLFDLLATDTDYFVRSTKFNSATSFSADYQLVGLNESPRFLRIADDNANRICSVSPDGQNWTTIHTVSRTDFLTADEVGFFVGPENFTTPNYDAAMLLNMWKEA